MCEKEPLGMLVPREAGMCAPSDPRGRREKEVKWESNVPRCKVTVAQEVRGREEIEGNDSGR